MLNSKGERELAYVVIVDGIEELPGYDRVESARIGGWRCIVPKGQFKVGDPGIYFEIDSKVPNTNPAFAFLEKRNYKIKTQKMCKSISQGLLMHAEDFGWKNGLDADGHVLIYDPNDNSRIWYADGESRFLTNELGVTYADDEDNKRKAPSSDKYKKMAQRHPEIFRQNWARWMMKRDWGKKLMFFFFGKAKDKKNGWPAWVQKTDEERIQNMPWILKDEGSWIATEKIDGSSTTFTMRRKRRKKEFYVCSRNVCFDSVDKPCYYDTNIYWEMAQKYNMYNVLSDILDHFPEAEWVTIQGETYGEGVQKRDYSIKGHDFKAFNLITSNKGRWNSCEMQNLLEYGYNVPCVPIICRHFYFKDMNVDQILEYAEGNSEVDGKAREGIVFRSEDGTQSFKAVSNSFLVKYHG